MGYPEAPMDKERREKSVWGQMAPVTEDVAMDEIRLVAGKLKQRRIAWGLTQGQLGELVCYKYGAKLSQTTVSRFEMMECTLATAKRLYKPMKEMMDIIDEIHSTSGHQPPEVLCQLVRQNVGSVAPIVRERKRRVTYTDDQLATLDALFEQCESPTSAQLNRFAIALGLGFSEVRVWFCNRRQKRRKTISPGKQENVAILPSSTEESIMTCLAKEINKDRTSGEEGETGEFNVPSVAKEITISSMTAPLIQSLEGMPKEEIVINVSQDA